MPIGPLVRRAFGRHERVVTDAYRALFVCLDDLPASLPAGSDPARILEIGCGEGALTTRLAARYPDARIVGIDPSDRAGRLFEGDTRRVTFHSHTLDGYVRRDPEPFDMILLFDVLHHVPVPERIPLLRTAGAALADGGSRAG